jgi:predicted metallo-beta-lactamase superfamily hydrolase
MTIVKELELLMNAELLDRAKQLKKENKEIKRKLRYARDRYFNATGKKLRISKQALKQK